MFKPLKQRTPHELKVRDRVYAFLKYSNMSIITTVRPRQLGHVYFCLLYLIINVSCLNYAQGFLLALPPGVEHTKLWERALIVFDPLTKSQTSISQVSVTGAVKSFAVLVPTSNDTEITYTTTSIWRKLQSHTTPKTRSRRTLKLEPYSWFIRQLIPTIFDPPTLPHKRDVLRSKSTTIHLTEDELHVWILKKGLTLTASQSLSVKEIYESGSKVATLWVKSKRKRTIQKEPLADETWTSTWIMTKDTSDPSYRLVNPTPIHPKLNTHSRSGILKIYLLTEWPSTTEIQRVSSYENSGNPIDAQSRPKPWLQPLETYSISRAQVNQLNAKLRSTMWNFKRKGVLSYFEGRAPQGVNNLYFKRNDMMNDLTLSNVITEERVHRFSFPLEVILILLYGLWWLWCRYARVER